MKLAIFCLLLPQDVRVAWGVLRRDIVSRVGAYAFPAEVEKDNKAVESKSVKSVVSTKDAEKSTSKQEKRAPVVQTIVPGELKYGSKIEYGQVPQIVTQTIQVPQQTEVKYVSSDPKSPYYEQPIPAPKPQYLFYTPQASSPAPSMAYHPMQAHLVLMLAVPHPSGQYMMLYPAQNFLLPMFYRQPIGGYQTAGGYQSAGGYQQSAASIPSSYQPAAASVPVAAYQPTYSAPALAQHAGFVAQHQLAYSPYRTEKYQPSKQQ